MNTLVSASVQENTFNLHFKGLVSYFVILDDIDIKTGDYIEFSFGENKWLRSVLHVEDESGIKIASLGPVSLIFGEIHVEVDQFEKGKKKLGRLVSVGDLRILMREVSAKKEFLRVDFMDGNPAVYLSKHLVTFSHAGIRYYPLNLVK